MALLVVAVALSAAGLRSVLDPTATTVSAPKAVPTVSVAMLGVAETFARGFVAGGGEDVGQSPVSGVAAGGARPESRLQASTEVLWTAPVAARPASARSAVVTVAVGVERETWYLAVPVGRTAEGALYVSSAPAVVGPPSLARRRVSEPELEVEDQALETVAARVVRHYLEGNGTDLAADLDRGAVVSLPRTALRVADIEATTWVAQPTRIAVHLIARGQRGLQFALRYELAVARVGGRWLVRSVHVNPLDREVAP